MNLKRAYKRMTALSKKELVAKAVTKLEELAKLGVRNDEGTGGDNARYGALKSDGYVYYNSYPCHANMKRYPDSVVVYSQFVHHPKIDTEAERAFFDWITGPTSPWKFIADRAYGDRDFQYKFGFIWDDLEHPANFQHNFLVATRMPKEWPKDIEKWYRWVKTGVSEAVAFFYMTLFVENQNPKGYTVNRSNKYDWPLDVCTAGENYFRNFVAGKVEKLSHNYAKNCLYTPVNRIFGDNELASVDDKVYGRVVYLRYWNKFGLPEEECKKAWANRLGLSTYDHRTHWLVTEDELISIMKAEESRLCKTGR